ncbi:hypothetical protein A2U01_0105368, partial [Trifolium medium]|nr:hypothetical protein [Trifolium medium]
FIGAETSRGSETLVGSEALSSDT